MEGQDFLVQLLAKLDTSSVNADYAKLKKQLTSDPIIQKLTFDTSMSKQAIKTMASEIHTKLGEAFKLSGVKEFNITVKDIESILSNIVKQPNKLAQINTTKNDLADIQKQIASVGKLRLGDIGFSQLTNKITLATEAEKRLNAELSKGSSANLDNINADLKEFNRLTNQAKNGYDKLMTPISAIQQQKMFNDITAYGKANPKAVKAGGIQYQNLLNMASQNNLTAGQLDQINAEYKAFQSEMKATGNTGRTTLGELNRGFKQIGQFVGTYGVYVKAVEAVKDMINNVKEIDTAMTNLYKVTDETDAKYSEFLSNAAKNAEELGRTINGYIEQTASWAKLGYSIDQSETLAKASSIYANVGEVSDETAVSDMVTALKSFNIAPSDSMSIVDKYNELGNKFATDAASLGDGLTNAASAMALAGNDIDQTLAMLTGGTEITQNASEMGNAIKVLSMRIRGMKGNLEELGEEYDDVESISKIQTQILNKTQGAVNIFDDSGNFKSTYEILKDISEVWDKISKTDQAALLEIVAGKQRGNQIAALIQSFQSGQTQKAYQTSLNSSGSAMKEQERWLTSIEAKTQQLEATWQEFSKVFLDGDFTKGVIDFGNITLNVFTKIIDSVGTLKTMLATGAVIKLIRGGKTNVFTFYNECATSPFSREVYEVI